MSLRVTPEDLKKLFAHVETQGNIVQHTTQSEGKTAVVIDQLDWDVPSGSAWAWREVVERTMGCAAALQGSCGKELAFRAGCATSSARMSSEFGAI